MHTVNLTSLSALKEIPAGAKCFSKTRSSTSIKDAGAVLADTITNFRPLFLFPFNKLCRPSISCIRGRAIPVTEVYKWQHQPKRIGR
jgi:hypothetical protein